MPKGWATLNELETNITITTATTEEAAMNSFIGGSAAEAFVKVEMGHGGLV